MKKRILALFLAVITCLSLSACDGEKEAEKIEKAIDESKTAMEKLSETADKKVAEKQKIFDKNKKSTDVTFSIDQEGTLKLKSYAAMEGMLDSKVLTVVLDFTNNEPSYNQSFYNVNSYMTLYQDGAAINPFTSSLDKEQATMIKPGATIEVITTYELRNETSDVEVECKDREGNVIGTAVLKIK